MGKLLKVDTGEAVFEGSRCEVAPVSVFPSSMLH